MKYNNFELLSEKELPIPKEEVIKFFDEYPQKNENIDLKVEKKEPLTLLLLSIMEIRVTHIYFPS